MIFYHPHWDTVALSLGPLAIHWYGLMYVLAFLTFYLLARKKIHQSRHALGPDFTLKTLDDLLFWAMLGVILGGRLGYVLFYQSAFYAQHPLSVLALWQGGMSFHGGLLGVVVSLVLFARLNHFKPLNLTDFVAPMVPWGLAWGRLGNFINGELPGRLTRGDFGMIFPSYGLEPRHPSQLYELLLEGLVLGWLLHKLAQKQRPPGEISGWFLMGYGLLRFLVEFTREPDSFLGFLSLGLTMGQWLSVPMIVIGFFLIFAGKRRAS